MPVSRRARVAVGLLSCLGLVACGGDPESQPEAGGDASSTPSTITVTSTAFDDGGEIPVRYTCDSRAVSPALSWRPSGGKAPAAWAIVVDDPDATSGTFVHWVVLDIPARTRSVGVAGVPDGAVQADTSAGSPVYAGPCPPSGQHHYRFTVYALSKPTGLANGAPLGDALSAIGDDAVAHGQLVGLYRRH